MTSATQLPNKWLPDNFIITLWLPYICLSNDWRHQEWLKEQYYIHSNIRGDWLLAICKILTRKVENQPIEGAIHMIQTQSHQRKRYTVLWTGRTLCTMLCYHKKKLKIVKCPSSIEKSLWFPEIFSSLIPRLNIYFWPRHRNTNSKRALSKKPRPFDFLVVRDRTTVIQYDGTT